MTLTSSILDLLAHLGRGALTAFWLPVLAWSAGAATVLAADALVPLRRPRLRAGLLAAVLAALPLGLALRAFAAMVGGRMGAAVDAAAPARLVLPEWTVEAVGAAQPPVDAMLGVPTATPWLALLLGAAVGIVAAWGLVALVRLVRAHRSLHALLAASDAAPLSVQARADALADRAGVSAPAVRLCDGAVPLAHRRAGVATVCLPRDLAGDDALTLALAHEIAHIAHGDLNGLVAERAVGALFAWHPLARLLTARLDLRREQACDAAVVAAHPSERRAYADLLVHVATRAVPVHAQTFIASMSVRPTTLRRRVAALLTPVSARRSPAARVAAAALALVLSAAAAAPFDTAAPTGAVVPTGTATGPVLLNRAELDAQAALRVPQIARQAGMSATVEVRVTIGETGTVTDAAIARSDNDLFNAPALVVARMARYTVPEQSGQTAVLALRFDALGPPPPPSPPARPALPILDPFDPAPSGDAPPDFVVVQRQPVPTTRTELVFPDAARSDSVEARVMARVWVGADGGVKDVQVMRVAATQHGRDLSTLNSPPSPYDATFADAARTALRSWHFTPAEQNGTPVAVWVTIPLRFRLSASRPPESSETSVNECGPQTLYVRHGEPESLRLDGAVATPSDIPVLECIVARHRAMAARLRTSARTATPEERARLEQSIEVQLSTVPTLEAAIARMR